MTGTPTGFHDPVTTEPESLAPISLPGREFFQVPSQGLYSDFLIFCFSVSFNRAIRWRAYVFIGSTEGFKREFLFFLRIKELRSDGAQPVRSEIINVGFLHDDHFLTLKWAVTDKFNDYLYVMLADGMVNDGYDHPNDVHITKRAMN